MQGNIQEKNNDSVLDSQQKTWKSIEDTVNRFDLDFSKIEQSKGIILFGVGIYGQIAFQYFKKNKIKVLFYCDNDINKQGKWIEGIEVISAQKLQEYTHFTVVITAKHYVKEISSQLDAMNIENISFDTYFLKKMLSKYKYVYMNLLSELKSREIYLEIIKSLFTGSNSYCRSIMEENAFWALPEFTNTGNEIFVDAGAFVGDTLEQFIWKNIGSFRKIYAFEPGDKPYKAMQRRVKRLTEEWCIDPEKIICVNAGLGEEDTTLVYDYDESSPLCSNFLGNDADTKLKVPVYSLDNYIGDGSVSFIKADIEGFELEMLRGAQNLIKQCRPKLAISVYHKPEDLYEIPMYIHSLVPDYKMAIRHHAPTLVDTVLYCWI